MWFYINKLDLMGMKFGAIVGGVYLLMRLSLRIFGLE